MIFAYVDEAYDNARYRLVAVLVDVQELNATHQAIRDVLDRANHSFATTAPELHAHDIFHGHGPWKNCHPRQRIGVYDQALSAIAARPVRVVVVGLERSPEPTNNWPIEAHHHLMAKLTAHLDGIARSDGKHLLVVADDHHAHAGMRDELRSLQLAQETQIVDTLHVFGRRRRVHSSMDA